MDAKKINVNGQSINIADSQARENIENLTKNKQDRITVTSPLSFENNKLSIDLSTKANLSTLEAFEKRINSNINVNDEKISNVQNKTVAVLKKAFGNSKINDDLTFDVTLSNLENYTDTINNINLKIENNKKETDNTIATLSASLAKNTTDLKVELNDLTNNYNNFSNSMKERLDWTEKELFGQIYSEDVEDTNSVSRIDKLEKVLNIVVGILLKENIMQIYHKTIADYNENSDTNNVPKINSTNFPYEI